MDYVKRGGCDSRLVRVRSSFAQNWPRTTRVTIGWCNPIEGDLKETYSRRSVIATIGAIGGVGVGVAAGISTFATQPASAQTDLIFEDAGTVETAEDGTLSEFIVNANIVTEYQNIPEASVVSTTLRVETPWGEVSASDRQEIDAGDGTVEWSPSIDAVDQLDADTSMSIIIDPPGPPQTENYTANVGVIIEDIHGGTYVMTSDQDSASITYVYPEDDGGGGGESNPDPSATIGGTVSISVSA